jgi:hypothetical protein
MLARSAMMLVPYSRRAKTGCSGCCIGAVNATPNDTTALYTRVVTNTIRAIMSPLDRLTPLRRKRDEPPA